jgi:hypothetical protein
MTPFHSLCPEMAQREVRCVHIVGQEQGHKPGSGPPPDEYAFLEFYCEDPDCDCRRVFLQVIARNQPGKIFASISYGWEDESFYRKRTPWDPGAAKGTVRGELDPINKQSGFAEHFLDIFQRVVLDESYRLRLRRHYQRFRQELQKGKRGFG